MKISRMLAIGLLALCTGCTNRLTDFTLISSKNIDVAALGKATRGSQRVSGKDVGQIVLFFPVSAPNIKNAMDKSLQQYPGSVALVDGVVYQQSWYIPCIYGQTNYIVEGTPLLENTSNKR